MTGLAAVLLRALVPSWRFFEDDPGEAVRLELRVEGEGGFGPWCDALPPPPTRTGFTLFQNPAGNHRLALHSLAHRLAAEESSDPAATVSYRLVENWMRIEARRRGALRFQFRLTEGVQPLLLSPELEA